MRVLVDPGTYGFVNLGTMALLQMAIRRLRDLWPEGIIRVLTQEPNALQEWCPGAEAVSAVGKEFWYSRKAVFGGLHRHLPGVISGRLCNANELLRDYAPSLFAQMLQFRTLSKPALRVAVGEFRAAESESDIIVVSGLGGFRTTELRTLDTLSTGIRNGCVTAMFSLGMSPEQPPAVLERFGRVVRHVDLIALREGRMGASFLRALNVDPGRVVVTGDDAIGLAYEQRPPNLGSRFGVSLRVQPSSEVSHEEIARLRPALQHFLGKRRPRIVALPSSLDPPDLRVINSLLSSLEMSVHDHELRDPRELIRAVGGCRLVLAGAYHVAVFALAQGIPVIAVAASPYFLDKFHGLSEQFGSACRVVSLSGTEAIAELEWSLEELWTSADALRDRLLAVAVNQVERSESAYRRLLQIASARQP
ncbi:MAG: polysaccharide pyruvyl transferase family protein [Thermoanaerobaculia bacterium]